MLVLDMGQKLQQHLLTNFLQNLGFTVKLIERAAIDHTSSIILLTDRPLCCDQSIQECRQIWLVDKHEFIICPIPRQVQGLLTIDCELAELETCIRQVFMNQVYLSPSLMSLLLQPPGKSAPKESAKLTARENQVFNLIKEGYSLRSIAEKLFISEHTAENHRANIQKKLNLSGRLSLVRFAATVTTTTD